MKTLTIRLPEELAAEIEAESHERKVSKSEVIRERLKVDRLRQRRTALLATISDLIGSVDGLPADLSSRTKNYLEAGVQGVTRRR